MYKLERIGDMRYTGKCITQYIYNATGTTKDGRELPVQVIVSENVDLSEILLEKKSPISEEDQTVVELFDNWFWRQWLYKKDKADARRVFCSLFKKKSQNQKAIIYENLNKHLQAHLSSLSDPMYCGKAGKWLRRQDFTTAPERDGNDDGVVGYVNDDGEFVEINWGDEE